MTVDDMLILLNVSVFSSCHVLLYPNVGAQCPKVTWERKLRRLGAPSPAPLPPGPAFLTSHVPLDSNGKRVRQAGPPPDRARHDILARRYRAAGARPSQPQVWILPAGLDTAVARVGRPRSSAGSDTAGGQATRRVGIPLWRGLGDRARRQVRILLAGKPLSGLGYRCGAGWETALAGRLGSCRRASHSAVARHGSSRVVSRSWDEA